MRVFVVVVIGLMFQSVCLGQNDSSILKSTSISAVVQANGSFFSKKDGMPLSYFNETVQPQLIRYSSSWMAGIVDGTVYANKNTGDGLRQLWPGPIDTATNLAKNAGDWSHVWAVSKTDVINHRENFENADYLVPSSFKEWPAKHDESNVNAYLAPFVDWNKNGKYDPENGDYPSFYGDHATYFIVNDLYGENVFPQANKMGLEIQGMAFVYDDPLLSNSIFVRLYIINRSQNDYAPFYFGQYADLELGNKDDNFIGTDVGRQLVYGYNGDSIDEGGFETSLPSVGLLMLNHQLHSSTGLVTDDSVRGFPKTEDQMLSILEGNWLTGSSKFANNLGISGSSNQETNYIYPGKTEWNVSNFDWRDENSGELPGARKILAVSKFPVFKSKSFKTIDFAFVFHQGDTLSKEGLFLQAENVINTYEKTLSTLDLSESKWMDVYPNPINLSVTDIVTVDGERPELWNLEGAKIGDLRLLGDLKNKYQIPCSEKLSSGIYLIKAITSKGVLVKKVILTTD